MSQHNNFEYYSAAQDEYIKGLKNQIEQLEILVKFYRGLTPIHYLYLWLKRSLKK